MCFKKYPALIPTLTIYVVITVIILLTLLETGFKIQPPWNTEYDYWMTTKKLLDPTEEITNSVPRGIFAEQQTVILMWTKYYAESSDTIKPLILSARAQDPDCCSQPDILITFDRKMLPKATVVVFYNWFTNLKKDDLPARYEGQLWVLFSKESPGGFPRAFPTLKDLNGAFNWTMSFRRDSDIWSPYGFYKPLPVPVSAKKPIIMPGRYSLDRWIKKKSMQLASVISHCKTESKREKLIQLLQNVSLPVKIYGKCGTKICDRNNKKCNHKFWKELGAKYKFYFAAENSLCEDYITEKFWRTLEYGMVPLVYGGADYAAVAPPNSFIDVRKFKTPKELVKFLNKVSRSPKVYAKYFEWRREYKSVLTEGWHGWCELCKKAIQYRKNPKSFPEKTYNELSEWWSKKHYQNGSYMGSLCDKPHFSL